MKALIVTITILSLLMLLVGFDFIVQHYPYGHFILYGSYLGFALAVVLALVMKK